jgi:hypothetical protein
MKKTSFKVSTTTISTTRTFENVITAEKRFQEKSLVTPPSEETVARLNAIAREYPFCAYLKQKNSFML